MTYSFRWMQEDVPGAGWQELFESTWPSYQKWFLKSGDAARPELSVCRKALTRYMPELVPTWERLGHLAGGNVRVARMLSLYCPAPYVVGCSQAVWTGSEPLLVRNYDYHPDAFEGVAVHTQWNDTRVMGVSDCLWGLLDGMNEHGLVAALAFGGRKDVGVGFGIPLILRYVLETCHTVDEAVAVLERVPSHMSYNVLLTDMTGDHVVVAVAPDRSTTVERRAFCTNHQDGTGWARYLEVTRSFERERRLESLMGDPAMTSAELIRSFLKDPLYSKEHARGFGTLYTTVYRPRAGRMSCLWPDRSVDQDFDDYEPQEIEVETPDSPTDSQAESRPSESA
tara:strand:+ start:8601 stop:9617 length:1017 start_codon:yes stop_codon:yes gene_type:complete